MRTFKDISRAAEDLDPAAAAAMLSELVHDERFPAVVKLIADHEEACSQQFVARTASTVDSHPKMAHLAGSLAAYRDIKGALAEVIQAQLRAAKKARNKAPKGA